MNGRQRAEVTWRRLIGAMVAAASVVCTLALLEVPTLLGHDYGVTFGVRPNDTWLQLASDVNRRDDELIHVHQPHTRYTGEVTGNLAWLGLARPTRYAVDVRYDKHGFRNDRDLTAADVVVIGDSFVEGAEVPHDRTVGARIGAHLGVTAANLGQSNYGPQQELVVLQRYGLPLSPAVVVWFFFGGNDLRDVSTYEARRVEARQVRPRPFVARSFARNAALVAARLVRRPPSADSDTAERHKFEFVRADGTVETQYVDDSEPSASAEQWSLVTDILLRARDRTRQARAELLVVYIPRKIRVYAPFLRAAPGALVRNMTLSDLPDRLVSWCADHDVTCLDSTEPLRAAAANGVSVYLTDDVHWNRAGHETVAASVATHVRQMPGWRQSVERTGHVSANR